MQAAAGSGGVRATPRRSTRAGSCPAPRSGGQLIPAPTCEDIHVHQRGPRCRIPPQHSVAAAGGLGALAAIWPRRVQPSPDSGILNPADGHVYFALQVEKRRKKGGAGTGSCCRRGNRARHASGALRPERALEGWGGQTGMVPAGWLRQQPKIRSRIAVTRQEVRSPRQQAEQATLMCTARVHQSPSLVPMEDAAPTSSARTRPCTSVRYTLRSRPSLAAPWSTKSRLSFDRAASEQAQMRTPEVPRPRRCTGAGMPAGHGRGA